MHFLLYVCIPRSAAKSSYIARRKVCRYLTEEGFDDERRFSGCCDYFSVGGRYSGQLARLKLRHEHPKLAAKFWRQSYALDKQGRHAESEALFRTMFSPYRGMVPFNRSAGFYGESDDAQLMDKQLYGLLRKGFGEEVLYRCEGERPNVIFTDGEEDWPENAAEAESFWVVVIDYHD